MDVASFTGSGFTFTDTVKQTAVINSITLEFTDTAFASITESSSNFAGLTYGISGDEITVNIAPTSVTDGSVYSATFAVGTSAVPEPSSVILLLTTLLTVAFLARKRIGQALAGLPRG
jgi:hypothetical protein